MLFTDGLCLNMIIDKGKEVLEGLTRDSEEGTTPQNQSINELLIDSVLDSAMFLALFTTVTTRRRFVQRFWNTIQA